MVSPNDFELGIPSTWFKKNRQFLKHIRYAFCA